jgi:hypothetical protein
MMIRLARFDDPAVTVARDGETIVEFDARIPQQRAVEIISHACPEEDIVEIAMAVRSALADALPPLEQFPPMPRQA